MQEFGARTGNVQRWWEQHEKFEKDLVMLQPFEDDDEDLLSKIDDVRKPWLEDRRSKKKSKKNKKKKQSGKGGPKLIEDKYKKDL